MVMLYYINTCCKTLGVSSSKIKNLRLRLEKKIHRIIKFKMIKF